MYNVRALGRGKKNNKKLLIITFGTLTNYCASKCCSERESGREGEKSEVGVGGGVV